MVSQSELNKALAIMPLCWSKQNDTNDKNTEFIYSAKTVVECLSECEKRKIKNVGYVIHRWYNFQTSKNCEELFVKYGAVKERNETHKKIDFYVNGKPFDLKLTVFPVALTSKTLDLTKSKDKDYLIRWFYENQSQDARKHYANRLFIVCKGNSVFENQWLKGNTPMLEKAVREYLKSHKNYPHLITINTDNGKESVFSDIILVQRKEL